MAEGDPPKGVELPVQILTSFPASATGNATASISKVIGEPLHANGNEQLANLSCSGEGTELDPYIIEHWVINSSGYNKDCIMIENTDAHFIIRNCTLTNADNGKVGIYCNNVTNGVMVNNTACFKEIIH